MPTLADIAALLAAPAPAGADRPVRGLATLPEAGPEDLTFVGTEAYASQLPSSRVRLPAVVQALAAADGQPVKQHERGPPI